MPSSRRHRNQQWPHSKVDYSRDQVDYVSWFFMTNKGHRDPNGKYPRNENEIIFHTIQPKANEQTCEGQHQHEPASKGRNGLPVVENTLNACFPLLQNVASDRGPLEFVQLIIVR